VYLERISHGVFSIGVFSPRRRNFQLSYDSPDCVALFGIGNAIVKNGIEVGKQMTGTCQFSKFISPIVSSYKLLPKLQDDAIMKVSIDRNTSTIRWYHNEDEIGSTTLPDHLKYEKLLAGLHLNYWHDKIRLNGDYP
jgi:hypothetical protein